MAYALQFLCTLLPTLLIEGLLLFAFGYRSKREAGWILLVNLVTQGGFAVYLAVTVLNHGVSGWSLIFYIPIEVIITLVELLLYRRLLTEKNKARTAVYAIAANLCSAVLGLWSLTRCGILSCRSLKMKGIFPMETEKLYYADPFDGLTATVLDCQPGKNGY